MAVQLILVFAITYLIGSIPFGYLIGKAKGIDIRQHGSGNIGATNVLRTLGKKYGIPCFFLDFMKGLLPVVLVTCYLPENAWAPMVAVLGTVIGHVFTCFLHFKGGKGVATTAGAMMGLAWPILLIGMVVWGITFQIWKYVSLSSIIASAVVAILAWMNPFGADYTLAVKILFTIMGILVIVRHRSNIKRLLKGEEPSFKKKTK